MSNINEKANEIVNATINAGASKGEIAKLALESMDDFLSDEIGTSEYRKLAQVIEQIASVYWDSKDPANPGPAYRTADGSGPLEFEKWSTDIEADGYNIGDFFDKDGCYLGPDQHGIYPIFAK